MHVCVCVLWTTYQSVYSNAGDDSPLESPQDEHGEGHDDANLPWLVLCRVRTHTHKHTHTHTNTHMFISIAN